MAAKTNSSWAPRGPRNLSRPRSQDALQVQCKPHLDLLALTSRCLEAVGAGERPGNVPGVLMDVARDLARWFFWTALRFERTYIAVESLLARYRSRLALVYGAARPKPLSTRAVVDVVGRVISKVAAREGAIVPPSTCRIRGCVARCPSPRRASSASGPHRKPYRRQAAPA